MTIKKTKKENWLAFAIFALLLFNIFSFQHQQEINKQFLIVVKELNSRLTFQEKLLYSYLNKNNFCNDLNIEKDWGKFAMKGVSEFDTDSLNLKKDEVLKYFLVKENRYLRELFVEVL